MGYFRAYPFYFKDDATGLHFCNVVIDSTLTLTHPHFSGFRRERFVREYPNPHFALPFHVTGECDTRRFNLTAGKTAIFHGFQCERAKGDGAAFESQAAVAAFLHFAIFLTLGL